MTQICVFNTHLFSLHNIHLIMQYVEPVSEWSCWRMFIETWPHSELNPRNVHLNNIKAPSSMCYDSQNKQNY